MTKIDKKILENIEILSKAMVKNGLSEVKVSDGNNSYELKKPLDGQSLKNTNLPEQPLKQKKETTSSEKALKSPLVGTAYLSPEPQAKTFMEVGQNVKIGQVLLIIEAMKTMNEITADRNGTIKKIFVKNEAPVEFGEPLVLIE